METMIAIVWAVTAALSVQVSTFSDDGSRGFWVGTQSRYCTVTLDENEGGGAYCQVTGR
jgi:hypothetical protein